MDVGVVVALLATGVIVAGGTTTAVVMASQEGDTAQVVRVVDGDTVEVALEGRTETVRLLNVDTPETVHPDQRIECLGPEAAAALTELLPVGQDVTLTYDTELRDRFGRLLAGVENEEGVFVNTELAVRGLGVAMLVEPNRRYYDDVLDAQQDARDEQLGLFSSQIACTPPGEVEALADGLPVRDTPVTPAAMDEEARRLSGVTAAAVAVTAGYEASRTDLGWTSLSVEERADLRRRAQGVAASAEQSAEQWRASAEQTREAEATAAEAERVRVEAAERQRAEAAAEQERRRVADAQAQQARDAGAASRAEAQRAARAASGGSTSSGDTSDPYPGYNGPRCYAPGGKTWKPC